MNTGYPSVQFSGIFPAKTGDFSGLTFSRRHPDGQIKKYRLTGIDADVYQQFGANIVDEIQTNPIGARIRAKRSDKENHLRHSMTVFENQMIKKLSTDLITVLENRNIPQLYKLLTQTQQKLSLFDKPEMRLKDRLEYIPGNVSAFAEAFGSHPAGMEAINKLVEFQKQEKLNILKQSNQSLDTFA